MAGGKKRQRRKEGMFGRAERWRDAVALGSCGPTTGSPLRLEILGGRGGAGWYITCDSEAMDASGCRRWAKRDHTQGLLGNPNTPGSQEAPTPEAHHDRVAGSIKNKNLSISVCSLFPESSSHSNCKETRSGRHQPPWALLCLTLLRSSL